MSQKAEQQREVTKSRCVVEDELSTRQRAMPSRRQNDEKESRRYFSRTTPCERTGEKRGKVNYNYLGPNRSKKKKISEYRRARTTKDRRLRCPESL